MPTTLPFLPFALPERGEAEIAEVVDTLRSGSWSTSIRKCCASIRTQRLGEAVAHRRHQFWPDSLSLLDAGRLRWDRVLTSRQITDAYLLALAVAREGHLVTFDRGISVDAVPGAAKNNLTTLN